MNIYQTNVNIKKMNSWGLASQVAYCATPNDISELKLAITQAPSDMPLKFLGLGSNILPVDEYLELAVIRLRGCLQHMYFEGDEVLLGAGVSCAKVAKWLLQQGHKDGVFFAGIPGTVGGAIRMNAGAFGGETMRYCVGIDCLNEQGETVKVHPDELSVGYRQISLPHDWCIVQGRFKFPHHPGSKDLIADLLKARAMTQPIGQRSCGSVFKNPPGHHAAQLIDQLGLKGQRMGAMEISNKHANFMINTGGGKGVDALSLIRLIQAQVAQAYQIELEPEVKIWTNSTY